MAEYAHESSGLGASSSLLTLYRHSGERIMDMEAAQVGNDILPILHPTLSRWVHVEIAIKYRDASVRWCEVTRRKSV